LAPRLEANWRRGFEDAGLRSIPVQSHFDHSQRLASTKIKTLQGAYYTLKKLTEDSITCAQFGKEIANCGVEIARLDTLKVEAPLPIHTVHSSSVDHTCEL